MKISHFLALFVALFLVACGGPPEDRPGPGPAANPETQTGPTAVSEVPQEPAKPTPTTAPAEAINEADTTDSTDVADTSESVVSASDLSSNYLNTYAIQDAGFGTQTNVVVNDQAKTRTVTSNALPNHDTGEFPTDGNPNTISAQSKSWTFTIEPSFNGVAVFAREPGVAINGVKFEPDTAERATCGSGKVHNIEAIQDVTSLGLDFNLAHVQPTGEYHYHGVSDLLVDLYSTDQDLVHVGFAADGYLIYYSKSNAYQASYRLGADAREEANCSYTAGGPNGTTITFGSAKDGSLKSDWDYNASYGQLDECNGITVDGQYLYLITNDYPYIPRCLMGEFTELPPGGGGGPAPQGGEQDGRQGGGPDFAAAAATLGVSENALRDALGPPPPDFEAAAAALGVSVEALQDAMGGPPP
ncbi:MAG: hypothetical protein ACI9EW_002171 [Cellvibrionaceae bacterium]|jgi:hypothetical protein